MSIRGKDVSDYLGLAERCADLADECSDLYQQASESRGKDAAKLRQDFDARLGEYLEANARRDRLWSDLLKQDGAAFMSSIAASHLGRLGRAVNSEAQQEAARENGKKGGRPKD